MVLTLDYAGTSVTGSVTNTEALISGGGQCADCTTMETLSGYKCVGCFPDVSCSP